MKTLHEAKIEQFGYKDHYGNISTYHRIIYIWKYSLFGISFMKTQKLPIIFENENDAIDFIECGCNVEYYDIFDSYGHQKPSGVNAFKIDDPKRKITIYTADSTITYKGESLRVVKGYLDKNTFLSVRYGKISRLFELIKEKEIEMAKLEEKHKKDEEYINSLYNIKTFKIEKIEAK